MHRLCRVGGTLAVVAGMTLAGCTTSPSGSSPTSSADGQSNILTIGISQDPTTFDPLIAYTAGTLQVTALMYDSLVTNGATGKLVPRLASSWDVSSDAKTVTIHLRPGMKWSDGKPFSSADVVFTFNVYADPKVATPNAGRLSDVVGFDAFQKGQASSLTGVTATDANTVVFKLSQPHAGFMSLIGWAMTFPMLPKHILGSVAPEQLKKDPFWNKPNVGMGPYVFVSHTPGEQVVLKRNPYFRTPAKIQTIYIKILQSNVAASEIGSGELDLTQIYPQDYNTVKGFKNVSVTTGLSPGFNRLAVNTTRPYLKNRLVRQAMLYAIDRAGIIKSVYKGLAKPINTAFMVPWTIPSNLNTYPYDPAKAKALLKQANWNPSQKIKLSWASGRSDWDQIATIVIADLKAVGMDVSADQTNEAGLTSDLDHKSFDLILYDGGAYTLDPETDFPILACSAIYPASGNITYFCDHQLDAAMQAGAETSNQTARAAAYQKAARIDNDEVPMIYLNIEPTIWAASSRLTNFVPFGDYSDGFIDAATWSFSG